MKIKEKIAIVTGASSGIGLATAKLLTKKGAKVALVARNIEKLETLSKELKDSFVVKADMTSQEDIKVMVNKVKDHFQRIDILVNNAGQGYDSSLEDIDIQTFREVIDLDLLGPVILMQQVIPIMRQLGQGSIINISSGTALMFIPNMSAYSSLKRAIVGISLTAREELKDDNIIVSVIYPYITDTDFEKNTIKTKTLASDEDFGGGNGPPQPGDSADYIAQKIVDCIESGDAQVFAHDWMKNR